MSVMFNPRVRAIANLGLLTVLGGGGISQMQASMPATTRAIGERVVRADIWLDQQVNIREAEGRFAGLGVQQNSSDLSESFQVRGRGHKRLFANFLAPATGEYSFVSWGAPCLFAISENSTASRNRRVIDREPTLPPGAWSESGRQRGGTVRLEAGLAYFIEAWFAPGDGAIGWRGPGMNAPILLGPEHLTRSDEGRKMPQMVPALARRPINRYWGDRAKVTSEIPGPEGAMTAWYRAPAQEWESAVPLGNGKLGAMVFGGVADERIQLNEQTLWDGFPLDADNPEALENLKKVRELIFAGRNAEARDLTEKKLLGVPKGVLPYQSLGELWMEMPGTGEGTNYLRQLELATSTAKVSYTRDGVTYDREMFISAPANVMVVRLTASKAGKIDLKATLRRQKDATCVASPGDPNGLLLKGQVDRKDAAGNPRGMQFAAELRAATEGGTVDNEGGVLSISKADSVTLYVTGATSYPGLKDLTRQLQSVPATVKEPPVAMGEDPQAVTARTLAKVTGRSLADVRIEHQADFLKYFDRVKLNLGGGDPALRKLPTDERLVRLKKEGAVDPELAALYFQFGRYLLIGSSRPGGLPANLQGIWAWQMNPPWNADFHTNINVQMNYWAAETTNLAELHEPLFDLMDLAATTGERTAKDMYAARGWVVHHLTDPWGRTAPADSAVGVWPLGSAWLARHAWEHYEFSGDRAFLEKRGWPLMKGAARFIIDFLIEAPSSSPVAGKLVTSPSMSPEHSFRTPNGTFILTYGSTMDLQIIHELLANCIRACDALGTDAEFKAECEKTLARLAPVQVSPKSGRIQEWIEDYEDSDVQHRHVSHLFALYPGGEIGPRVNAEMAAAARKVLERRGDGGTGWSMAWKINFWARLHDGDHAMLMLSNILKNGTLPNLFDTHPPFQIDGNFGACAAIAEMLMQSQVRTPDGGYEIHLLPALPSAFPNGSVSGLRARGGVTVDIAWENAKLSRVTLRADRDGAYQLRFGERTWTVQCKAGQAVTEQP